MEFTRKSESETEANNGLMYGYIYIDGEKVDIECTFAKRAYSLKVYHLGAHDGESVDAPMFTAKYRLKGDTLTLKTFDGDDYLIGEYSKITLTMTNLS